MQSGSDTRSYALLRTTSRSIRIVVVVVDTLIAIGTAIILPSAIFLPYALKFDYKNVSFPDSLLYGDTTFLNLVLENRVFFFLSWSNALIKAVPHLSAFLCLRSIATILKSANRPDSTAAKLDARLAAPTVRTSSIGLRTIRALSRATTRVHNSRRLHRIVFPMAFAITGGVVLILHLKAHYTAVNENTGPIEDMCLQQMHPWLASNFSCAILNYNCFRADELSPRPDSLSWLERGVLRRITFMHCPALVVPSVIREFSSLMGIEIWNSTLLKWGKEAAVSAPLHQNMLFIIFVFVNMTGIPAGILTPPLPELLTDLEFIHTNLTAITEDVTNPWSGVRIVYIEHSHLDIFPSVLMHLPVLSELSLINNKIETMPRDALLTAAATYYYDLSLSRNPLRELPDARTDNFHISYLSLEFTQLTDLPAWVDTVVWESVSLGGSPLCDGGDDTKVLLFACCGKGDQDWDPLGPERYPIHLMQPFRLLSS
ncbi:unnamed protein product [Phytophthora fragariaefolia]|uniref:Unnamed protein product n=1 Tax=Phytophthora fragariaefolia TaxID=1490495 RepID=A0A9W6XKF2_9STRA|nr:unnamed protein product [Phytophthora fragariaefolia]